MPRVYLGLDVSKVRLDVALLVDDKPRTAFFDNTPSGFQKLRNWLRKRTAEPVHACLEATGTYGQDVAQFLTDEGHQVSVVNPARIKAYGQSRLTRNKTDQIDAQLIADFCATQQPPLWTPPPVEYRELQAMVRHLEALKAMRQQEQNRLTSGVTSPTVTDKLHDHITFLDQQIDDLLHQIRDHIDRHPDLRQQRNLLKTIPGIGDITAFTLLAEIRDIRAFDSARQLAAFAGLSPRQYRSGSSVRGKTHLSKTGSAALRKALYMPALVSRRYNPLIIPFADRLAAHGKAPMVIIGAVMRKLLHIVFGVLKSNLPFDPDYLAKQALSS
jgi:transposase